jgi:hypothetical protein
MTDLGELPFYEWYNHYIQTRQHLDDNNTQKTRYEMMLDAFQHGRDYERYIQALDDGDWSAGA